MAHSVRNNECSVREASGGIPSGLLTEQFSGMVSPNALGAVRPYSDPKQGASRFEDFADSIARTAVPGAANIKDTNIVQDIVFNGSARQQAAHYFFEHPYGKGIPGLNQ